MHYKQKYIESIENLNSDLKGLSNEEIKKRLDQNGYNELKETKKVPTWKLFLESFKDPLIIILLIAAIVQIFLGEVVESIIILIVIILNSVLGVTQTKKAEGSLESLKKLSAPQAKVLRNNHKLSIPARELVVGDIVLLEAGDYIPADGRIIEAQTLKIVEGMLTGESEPVLKHNEKIDEDVGIGDQRNMVFSGSLVVYGRGSFVVTSTGMNTEMGKVAGLLETAENKQTPLQEKLDEFGKKLGIAIVGIAVLIFIIQVVRGFMGGAEVDRSKVIIDSFMFAIAVAVAAIPEALSSIVTIVLSVGTNAMAKKQAIVRKLPAVETLGSTSVICTDKTGTLTQNKMTVVDFYMYETSKDDMDPSNINYSYHSKTLTIASAICNDSNINNEGKEIGDPTEVALIKFANRQNLDYKKLREKYDRLSEIPFDSDRKLMSTVNVIHGDSYMFTKGAPDVVFSRCKYALVDGDTVEVNDTILNAYKSMNEEFSNRALRVLAFAIKDVEDENFVPALEDEVDMTLVGLMAMIDPPREEVFDAVKEAKSAGIKTVMITGDHKTTAAAIAKDIGIMEKDDIALTGQELDSLTEKELDEKLEHISVYARVSPENKIRIVKAWQNKGKITAMTGDGVNDAPALKQANIGIGMGSGTDVAKDASAMILVDDNFATIVNAVEVGRTVYKNIKKSITYLFAGNFAGILAILFAVFANWANPFTTLQLLFINLITDSLPAIALGFENPEKNIMSKKPRDPNESILAGGTIQAVAFRGVTIAILVILAQYIGMKISPEVGTAMAFSTITLARILQTLPARSNEYTLIELGVFSNMYVIYAVLTCLLIYSLTLLPFLRDIFSIPYNFGVTQLGICFGLAMVSTVIMEIAKIRHKNNK
ncbi:cation-translocating P-type ATPase [Romboutsia lituseburensis]|uniref:P-type Ca(2+) transporter n=1 Tax=Romboutsia lituseburensis DSM 797 TaxID=1121325 RepID=A0A1G9L6Y2_9FIRM|nr:cation-translocating P-type ATPase [Romboutsia lituseburensis]CEH35187.1 Calcium-transporting ATPase lmo0841 [Romboutsia lituseburensis]SDL57507.1 Ca2+-transporting ATPase [Romboutsia lituseburensis DSM 797]